MTKNKSKSKPEENFNYLTNIRVNITANDSDHTFNEYDSVGRGHISPGEKMPNIFIVLSCLENGKNEAIKAIKNLRSVKGIAQPDGICFDRDRYKVYYKDVQFSFTDYLEHQSYESNIITKMLKDFGIALQNLHANGMHLKAFLLCNLVAARENETLTGQIFDACNPLVEQDLKFYEKFPWFQQFLEIRTGERNDVAKLGFCFLFSLCGKAEDLFKSGLPDFEILSTSLKGNMKPYRISLLCNLLYQMVHKENFSMTKDFFNHPFFENFQSVMELLSRYEKFLENNIVWRAHFNQVVAKSTALGPTKNQIGKIISNPFGSFKKFYIKLKEQTKKNDDIMCKDVALFQYVIEFFKDVDISHVGMLPFSPELFQQIIKIVEEEGKEENDGEYITLQDKIKESIREYRWIGTDSTFQCFNILRGHEKDGRQKTEIIAIEAASNTSFNLIQSQPIKFPSEIGKGVLTPELLLCDRKVLAVYKNVCTTFAKTMIISSHEDQAIRNRPVKVKQLIEMFLKNVKKYHADNTFKVIMPENLLITLIDEKLEAGIMIGTDELALKALQNNWRNDVLTPILQKQVEFYKKFTWLHTKLSNRAETNQMNLMRMAFCLLYSLCLEDFDQFKSNLPTVEMVSGFLKNRMKDFRIIMLHGLLSDMINGNIISIDEALSHIFFWKRRKICDFIMKAKTELEKNKELKFKYDKILREFEAGWRTNFTKGEKFVSFFANTTSCFTHDCRHLLAHMIDPAYIKEKKEIHKDYLETKIGKDKGENYACILYCLQKLDDYPLKLYKFFRSSGNLNFLT